MISKVYLAVMLVHHFQVICVLCYQLLALCYLVHFVKRREILYIEFWKIEMHMGVLAASIRDVASSRCNECWKMLSDRRADPVYYMLKM